MVFTLCLFLMALGILLLDIRGKISYIGSILLISSISIPLLYIITPISFTFGSDLSRYFLIMEYVSKADTIHSLHYLYETIPLLQRQSSSTIFNIIEWLISRTGYFSLLSCTSVFIVYMCCLLPFIHLRNKYKISLTTMIFGFLLMSSLFPYIISGSVIRFSLASSLFIIVTYFYLHVKHKYVILPLYFLLIFIHESMILPFILIMFCTFFKKIRWRYLIIFILAFYMILLFINIKGNVDNNLINITKGYLTNSSYKIDNENPILFFNQLLDPYGYSILSFVIVKNNKGLLKKYDLKVCYKLFILFNLVDILLLPFQIISERFSVFVGIISIFLLFKVKISNGRIFNWMKYAYFIIFIIMNINNLLLAHEIGMAFNFTHIMQY